jgi:hypothetical protein
MSRPRLGNKQLPAFFQRDEGEFFSFHIYGILEEGIAC